jgi:hypothetical protein
MMLNVLDTETATAGISWTCFMAGVRYQVCRRHFHARPADRRIGRHVPHSSSTIAGWSSSSAAVRWELSFETELQAGRLLAEAQLSHAGPARQRICS